MDSDHLIHHLEDPANAIAPYPSFYEGPRLDVDLGIDSSHSREGQSGPVEPVRERYDDNSTLWVGNLDLRVSETILFELFSQVGDVKNITFPKQKLEEEKTTGFCFVNFLVPDSVPRAIEVMQGTVLFGRRLFLKCRPDSIHAMNKPGNCRTVKLVKKPSNAGYRPRIPSQYSPDDRKSFRGQGKSRVVELRGESKYSENPNGVSSTVCSSGTRYSPIRAPSPEERAYKLKGRKFTSPEDRSYDATSTSSSSRRKVVIRSSSGSVVPVINIPNSETKLSSVIVTPQAKAISKSATSEPPKPVEAERTVEQATSTTTTHPSRDPSNGDRHSFQNCNPIGSNTNNGYEQSVTSNSGAVHGSEEAFQCNQGGYYRPYGQNDANYQQQWHTSLPGPNERYSFHSAPIQHQGQPVMPHYNRYVWFNGNSRYQNNSMQRFRSFQPRQNCIPQQSDFGNYSTTHPRPPGAMYNPRFPCFRPPFNGFGFPPNNVQFQPPPQRQSANHSLYYGSGFRQEMYQQPPPRLKSRSRTRSRSRSKSPYRSRYPRDSRDRSRDKFSRIGRSRSISPGRPRRSNSRDSSYDRYHRSRRTSRSSSSDLEDYQSRKRQRRSRSYSSSMERQKSREFLSSANNSRNSSISRESGREKGMKAKERVNSTTSTSESENDTEAVTSSSQKAVGTRKKWKGKPEHQNTLRADSEKQGKNKKFRRSSQGSEAEEYDPSDPGY